MRIPFLAKPTPFSQMTAALPRAELKRQARIALLDDDVPEVLRDLRENGFSVDHLESVKDPRMAGLETGLFDLLLLDFGGIGEDFGEDEGLDVLRHLLRVNPGLVVIAFTGRTFDASKSDFFRLCKGVLKKDAGIRETLEAIELHLAGALTPAHQWATLCAVLDLDPGSDKAKKLEKSLRKAVRASDRAPAIKEALASYGPAAGKALIEFIAGRLIQLAAGAVIP